MLPYQQIEDDDVWVDDPDSADYNRWTKRARTAASSFEEMKRNDDLYRYGIVFAYNRNPIVKGLGSAIFLHPWRACDTPTSGCVALAEKDMVSILAWLDPSRTPLSVMGDAARHLPPFPWNV